MWFSEGVAEFRPKNQLFLKNEEDATFDEKKKRTVKKAGEEQASSVPRSFVLHRGDVGKSVLQLEMDLRRVMEPYTALNLKVKKNNVLKDFVHVAGPIGVTHFLLLSKSELSTNFRLVKVPRGPTLTFKVQEYSLIKDVAAIIRRPKSIGNQFIHPPLLVLNNFNMDTLPMKLMTTMFQNMFPSINVQKVKLSDIRRCVLINYNNSTNTIDFRHYNIDVVPVGLSHGAKKLVRSKVPDLGSLMDISEYMTGGCYLSESEGEEPMDSQITLPQQVRGKGNIKSSQSAIKLIELGPRMTLELVKIEEGLCGGEVLFHEYVTKTEEEKEALRKKQLQKKKQKEQRKKQQEENVKRKQDEKEKHKQRSLEGMRGKNVKDNEVYIAPNDSDSEAEESEEDDIKYFKAEVGEDPDEDLFSKSTENQRKRKGQRPFKPSKRHKPDVTTDKRLAKDQVGTDSKKKRTRNETSEGSKDITSNRRSKKSKEAFSKGTLTHRKSTFSFKAKAKFPKTTKKMRGR